MKIWLLIGTIILGGIVGCKKEAAKTCLKGKVVRITCASTVIQALNDNSMGEDGWVNYIGNGTTTYDNVFKVSNKCILSSSIKQGDIVWFALDSSVSTVGNCSLCDLGDHPPAVAYRIKNVSSNSCLPD